MFSSLNDSNEEKCIRKVTISPISPDILSVSIRKMSTEKTDIPKKSTPSRALDYQKSVSGRVQDSALFKSAENDNQNISSFTTQTATESSTMEIISNLTEKKEEIPKESSTFMTIEDYQKSNMESSQDSAFPKSNVIDNKSISPVTSQTASKSSTIEIASDLTEKEDEKKPKESTTVRTIDYQKSFTESSQDSADSATVTDKSTSPVISQTTSKSSTIEITSDLTEKRDEENPKASTTFRTIDYQKSFPDNSQDSTTVTDNSTSSIISQVVSKSSPLKSISDLTLESKSTMTDRQESYNSLQTASKGSNLNSRENEQNLFPCLKHAAQNISRRAEIIPDEKIKLCSGCSKSMLSYIFLVQDFLDSLAKEINGEDTSQCLQCARQKVRDSIVSMDEDSGYSGDVHPRRENISQSYPERGQNSKYKGDSGNRTVSKRTSRTRSHRQESKRNEVVSGVVYSPDVYPNQQRVNFVHNEQIGNDSQQGKDLNVLSGNEGHRNKFNSEDRISHQQKVVSNFQDRIPHQKETDVNFKDRTPDQKDSVKNFQDRMPHQEQIVSNSLNIYGEATDHSKSCRSKNDETFDQNLSPRYTETVSCEKSEMNDYNQYHSSSTQLNECDSTENIQQKEGSAKPIFKAPMQRIQPNYDVPINTENKEEIDTNNKFFAQVSQDLFKDGIVSSLSDAEREIYDTARNGAGWESLTEPQLKLVSPSSHTVSSEAFVTSCRNNAEAIGCLVVGTSLLLSRTSRTLCVLVSDGVSTAFRGALSAVFKVVQNVRSLDSLGTTKLALIEQPELGVTFDKLNIWRLTQFKKCVYLNPDTLVIQNCDEMFCHEELSAVPDIGWPDCFNSGVFVFAPSINTFWQLMEFAEKQGSYDGGDQGLLNSYFSSWSSDISKKLSFIYNLMANVSYTYTPAFKQFGRNVKVVQFHGSFKPWHVKFFTNSGQISPSSPVHPTYVQFVHIWINIFRISVLRLMSQKIQSYAASEKTICAVEILRFFPLPTETEAEFFLTPPSVRLRLAEKKLNRSSGLFASEVQRRKSAEFLRYTDKEDATGSKVAGLEDAGSECVQPSKQEETQVATSGEETSKNLVGETNELSEGKIERSTSEVDDVFKEKDLTVKEKVKELNTLPGAEVGDYQGMAAWEQGRIDYEGSDSSDNVIKRLQFLMSRPK